MREAAAAAFQRNPTLRQTTSVSWDERGIVIAPIASLSEHIPWSDLRAVKINDRIVLLQQRTGAIHAIPKRAFDRDALATFRALARRAAAQSH